MLVFVRVALMLALVAAVAAGMPIIHGPSPASAQSTACQGAINGELVTEHDTWRTAIPIDASRPVDLALRVNGPVGTVRVTLTTGPIKHTITPVGDREPAAGTSWSGLADVDDTSGITVGLTQVRLLTSSGCELTFWVEVVGESPVTAMAGATGATVCALGIAFQLFGFVRGARGSGGLRWSTLGGLPTGLGACVVAQQAGVTPLTWEWAAAWTTPSVVIGGVLEAGISAFWPNPGAGDAAPAVPPDGAGPTFGPRAGAGGTYTSPTSAGGMVFPPRSSSGASVPPFSPPAAPTATAVPPVPIDPPRTAYGLLQAPDVAVAGATIDVAIGLAAQPQLGVAGGPLIRPASSVGSYVLTVQLVADGFTLAPGESWRHELPVTAQAPYPAIVVRLQADPQDAPIRPRVIQALFSVDGQTMGMAVRAIAVIQSASLTVPPPESPADGSVDIAIPTDPHPADLTVRIQHAGSQSGGRLLWTFDSPHGGLDIPDAPAATDIGSDPGQFLRQVIEGIGAREGKPGLYAYLAGLGVTIADEMPAQFWALLAAIAGRRPAGSDPPTVFILSEEPYIPWELAFVAPPLSADSTAAPFLGAQACVGRWSLGQRRPKLPPPTEVHVEGFAIIAGVYDREGWTRLVEAEGEAAELAQRYGGEIVEARSPDVLRCLAGDPEANLFHFALHGVYDPDSVTNGLVLIDGATLDPLQVRGQMLRSAPFVFLNACQVGSGSRVLGDYAGMAESFLYAGASGVIAPLWSISDGEARALSTRFYERAFAGEPLSAILRAERAAFRDVPDPQSDTALAYIFYGHPSLRMVRP